ncbi:swi5-dependent recombination DNA repair protein 1 homolog [Rhinatrema bivittatum]|uniref:swi5-dependent recombination DNA repair protein 1 homolog n=1 Tax=Rhinatrema bivittatum TaxID=194408 RepID=UPI00112755AD|nr:swi5-dependent recombination DNA repair protein 1 homolog [Rhinatrema bivittatum]
MEPSGRSMSGLSTPEGLVSPVPSQHSTAKKQPMSASLKERLKKTRLSFNSYFTVAKRLKIDYEENDSAVSTDSLAIEGPGCSSTGNLESFVKSSDVDTNINSPLQDKTSRISTPSTSLQNSPQTICLDVNPKLQELLEEKRKLAQQVQEKEELLRRLKMVKMYRSKNDLTELQSLTEKWRRCSQQVLYELQSALSTDGKKLSLSQLIDSFGLEDKLLHYNRAEEDFIDP